MAASPMAAEISAPERERSTPSGRRVLRAATWTVVGQAAVQVPWFGSLIVLAALVSPAAFGTASAGIAVVGVALLLVGSGTRGALVAARRVTASDVLRATARTTLVAALLAGAMAAGAGLLVESVARGGDAAVLRWLALGIALYGIGVVPLALLQRDLRAKRQAAILGAGALCGAVIAIVAGALGAGVWALVVRQVVSSGVIALVAWASIARLARARRRALAGSPTRPDTASTPDPEIAEGSADTAGPRGEATRATDRANRRWFVLLALAGFVALNLDYYLVGLLRDVQALGPYALAFMIAFAPVTQVSWQLGKVLFPAASATADRGAVGARTAEAIAACALLLVPLLAPAVALAPWLFPAVLGDEWKPLVVPFQLLLAAGTLHALANLVGESLSGTGNVGLHARCHLGLVGGLAALLPALIALDGARGAAIAHLIAVVPFATVYFTLGARRIGTSPRAIWLAVSPVAGAVAVQAATTGGALAALHAGGVGVAASAVGAAAAGLVAFGAVTWARPPRALLRVLSSMGLRGRPAAR